MHFDPRTQTALREVGLSTEEIQRAAQLVVDETQAAADAIGTFFATESRFVSDMDKTHGDERYPEHRIDYVDLYTHGADLRGYVRFETWGVSVEGGRILKPDRVVELSLGPTVDGRVRFARQRDDL